MITSITISEWETLNPENHEPLARKFLDPSPATKTLVSNLRDSQLIRLTELRAGLEIKTFSHVGRLRIGDVEITILPKLRRLSLLRLLRYAFGFRRLRLLSDSQQSIEQFGFEDLLISQLNSEAQELISRGLRKAYVAQDERLGSPRGRIDIQRLALDGGTITATLPCRHHPRIEDTQINQVLLAGLHLAGSMASVIELRRESKKLAALLEEKVSRIVLDLSVLEQAERRLHRLNTAYVPAISIIRLLAEAKGISLHQTHTTSRLPGFLFDMNTFFQALVGRFLRENLPGYVVKDEHGLRGMMKYLPAFNPQNRRSPTPRPDYIVQLGSQLCSILDAKYRDLWEKRLPRDMLYQLVVYAVSHQDLPRASILFPTSSPTATESRIDVSDPIYGRKIGQVCLRPVNLEQLEKCVSDNSTDGRRRRLEFASQLAFGDER